MLMADGLYLEPTEDMEQMLEEQNATYCASEVGYKITYLSEELISTGYDEIIIFSEAQWRNMIDLNRDRQLENRGGIKPEIEIPLQGR